MKTNTRDKERKTTEWRRILPFTAAAAVVFFLMPGIQLPAGTGNAVIEPAYCADGNFRSVTGPLGKSTCLKDLVVPAPEGGEAPDAVALPEMKNGKHHKGKGHKGKKGGHHGGKKHGGGHHEDV